MTDTARPQQLWELVKMRAAATPDGFFAIDEADRTMTFGEYKTAVERAAAGLAMMGIGDGTVVSWQLPTWLESMVLVGALSRLGAVQNPILPIYREREVRFALQQTGARFFIVPTTFRNFDYKAMADALAGELDNLGALVCDRSLPDGDPSSLPPEPPVSDDPPVRWIFYSSGTTADPKGARHTDHTIFAACHAMNLGLEVVPDDRDAFVFPFTHIGGITWLFSGLLIGMTHIVTDTFDPAATVAQMQKYDATILGAGTPFHMAYLAEQRKAGGASILPTARVFSGGGAPKPPQLHYDLKKEIGGVGVVSGYGLTEVPILTMASTHDPDDKLANTEGRPGPGVDLRVVTLEGKPAGPNEEGEFRVKAPQMFKGYLDEKLTKEAFDSDGYFRTGDLGHLDEDGYIVVTGRLKDVIIRKGENISAKEVEDLLYTHPKVADVAVIGLPDPALGERCCAVVANKDANDPLTFAEMGAYLREQGLMVQKIPEQLETVDAVPRNASGKILKHKLREEYAKS